MHVLLLAPGISIHSRRFLQMLLDAGHRVAFVDEYNPKPEGAPDYRFIPYPFSFLDKIRRGVRVRNWIRAKWLKQLKKSLKADLIHLHWIDKRAVDCANSGAHPLVMNCWGKDINQYFFPGPADLSRSGREAAGKSLAVADYVTADTQEILSRCDKLAGRKLTSGLFYFGIDTAKFSADYKTESQELRKSLGVSPSAKVFLSVRRLIPQMRHHVILKAFAQASKTSSEEAVLVFTYFLASPDSDYIKQMKETAAALGIDKKVIWMDGIDYEKLPVLYAMSDVVLNFPEHDGLPVSLFEAAAGKKPVITAGLEAYSDFLRESKFIVVPPEESAFQQLTDAIRKMLSAKREDLSKDLETNYRLIMQKADKKKCLERIETIYREVTSQQKQ